jgi:predicted SAM-dependent methyltransferase
MKLHIGSQIRAVGWTNFDIVPGPGVDIVGDCRDLSRFADGSVETIYASHVLEHIGIGDIEDALRGWHRVLAPGGEAMIAVPDLNILAQVFVKPALRGKEKFDVVRMIFGGQIDAHDFHMMGFDLEVLGTYLTAVGFIDIRRVSDFGLFNDTSCEKFHGIPISLNVVAKKGC